MPKRRPKNIDFIKGGHWPLQTYAWSGTQWGASANAAVNGKAPTSKPPMNITSQPPGAFAKSDEEWSKTFGASHDAVLSIMNGQFLAISSQEQSILGIYRDALPNIQDFNLFRAAKISANDPDDEDATSSVQQIQYIVSKNTVSEAQTASQTSDAGTESELRGIGMRSPLMMAGWGKTVGIRPTDPEPTTDMNKRKNDEEHKVSRETWKYGAVDVRWDERRGVWAAWQDLIADQEGENLGSLVFSTNPDAICGFPFLKGKLEDVWWVRKTPGKAEGQEATAGQDDDFIQTGEICTHLGHQLYDNTLNNVSPLSTVFLVDDLSDNEVACGSEKTKDGRLEIRTSTFHHLNNDFHGPICFSQDEIEDDDLVGCMKFPFSQWVPTVKFDICDVGGIELGITFDNDKVLANAILKVCKLILKILGLGSGAGAGLSGGGGALQEASDTAATASDSALDAAQAFDDIPPGKISQSQQGLSDAAEAAYDNSSAALNDLAVSEGNAASAQDAADAAAIDSAQASALQVELAALVTDLEAGVQQGVPEAAEGLGEATKALEQAELDANAAFNKAEEAKQAADAALSEAQDDNITATDAAEAAAEANQKFEDSLTDAQKNDPDIKDALDKADKADQDAADALRDAKNANAKKPTAFNPECCDNLKKSVGNLVNQMNGAIGGMNVGLAGAGGATDAAGQATQKAFDEIALSMTDALGIITGAIDDLVIRVGDLDGGQTAELSVSIDSPVACPTGDTTTGEVPPIDGEAVDAGGTELPPPTGGEEGTDTGGGLGVQATQAGQKPPISGPGTAGGPPGGGGSLTTPGAGDGSVPPTVPPADGVDGPDCPIFTIVDPCSKQKTEFGPCPTATSAGSAGVGDPGDPDAATEGGIDPETGEVFSGKDKEIFGTGGDGKVFGKSV